MSRADKSFKNLFDQSLELFKKRWFYFLRMSVVFFIPILILEMVFWYNGPLRQKIIQESSVWVLGITDKTLTIVTWFYFIFYLAAFLQAVHNAHRGIKAGALATYRQVLYIFGSYLWVKILYVVRVLGWSALLLVPGVIFGVLYSYAGAALIIDQKRGMEALLFSRKIIKTQVGRYLTNMVWVVILIWTSAIVISIILDSYMSYFAVNGHLLIYSAIDYVKTAVFAAAGMFLAIFYYYLYIELRDCAKT